MSFNSSKTAQTKSFQSKLITIFNKQIQEFCDQIVHTFPHLMQNRTVQQIYNTLLTTISLTPNVPINLFYVNFVNEYDEEILSRNEDFFLENFNDDSSIDSVDNGTNRDVNPIEIVKFVYKDASEENKKIIWDYIQRLRLICLKYYQSTA